MIRLTIIIAVILPSAALTAPEETGAIQPPNPPAVEATCSEQEKTRVEKSFGRLPLYFIENRGQIDGDIPFYVKGADKTLYFTSKGITFALKGRDNDKTERWVVKLDFVSANPDVKPRGKDKQKAIFSYFKGRPEDWKTGLPTYSKLVYEDLWPGINLVYSGTVNEL